MIKILLLIDYSSEFDRKLLRGLVQYSKENGPWLFYRLTSYYSAMHGEQGILRWAKEWNADAIIGQWNNDTIDLQKELNIPVVIDAQIDKDDKVFPMVAPGAPISECFGEEDVSEKFGR